MAPQTVHNWLVAAGVSRRPSPATVRQDISDDEIVGESQDRYDNHFLDSPAWRAARDPEATS